jgi:translation initiation factor IF-1
MAKNSQDNTVKEGQVIEALPNATFRIVLDDEGGEVFGYLSGKMRLYYIKVVVGDKVSIEFTPYDDKKGRIIKRL